MQNTVAPEKRAPVYKQWNAVHAKAVLLLVHGFGGHKERWEFLADFLLKQGISSYALDLEGFGDTKGLEGGTGYFNVYFEDILRLYNIIRKENPGKKVYLVGESMGGLVSFLLAALEAPLFEGLICISPLFRDKLKFSPLDYLKVIFFAITKSPKEISAHFTSEMCTRDGEYLKVMASDPREIRVARGRLYFDIVIGEIRAQFLKDSIKIPVLFLLAGRDMLIDLKMSKAVLNSLKTEDKTLISYPEMYHALSIDIGRERVFEDISLWLQKRLTG